MNKPIKLNLGCGSNRIDGFINIDVEPSCKPDIVCNFIGGKLPYKNNTVSEVVLFHTIEHISKRFHNLVLKEIWRVLKPGGLFIVSYPEFLKCVENWKINFKGQKTFWEATIYGRQAYPSDFHVTIMHTPDFKQVLEDNGFIKIKSKPEPLDEFNSVVSCVKGPSVMKYEDLIKADMRVPKIGIKQRPNKINNSRKS